jgi:uncharacterized protein (DUF427 family)
MPTATWHDATIARSDRTVMVEGNHYFPPSSVDRSRLQPSAKVSVCPWKGIATYFNVVVDGQVNSAAAWTYRSPCSKAAHIAEHVAFRGGVEVSA